MVTTVRFHSAHPGRPMRVFRAALALCLIAAMVLGATAIGAAPANAVEGLPCQMQMADLEQPIPQDAPPQHRKQAPACPMMVGGLCLVLCALTPTVASIPSPPHIAVPTIWREEAAPPQVIPPLRRPPRQL
jgi:hypothetical protein